MIENPGRVKFQSKDFNPTLKSYMPIPCGDKVSSIPPIHTKEVFTTNSHALLHNSREYLAQHALMKEFDARSLLELHNKKIATISSAAGLQYLFPYGNYFVNQATTGNAGDFKRSRKSIQSLFNSINDAWRLKRTYRSLDVNYEDGKTIPRDIPVEPDQRGFNLLMANTCDCYLKDRLCNHILQFKPSVIVMPHSIYYLSKDLLINIFKDLPGVQILVICHLFDPIKDSGSVNTHIHQYEDYILSDLKSDHQVPVDEIPAKTRSFIVTKEWKAANWYREKGQIVFRTGDEEEYRHKDVFGYMYSKSNQSSQGSNLRVVQRIQHDNCQHVAMFIEGGFSFELEGDTAISQPMVITNRRTMVDGCIAAENGGVSVVDPGKGEEVMLIRKVESSFEFIDFRMDSIPGSLITKVKAFITASKQGTDIMSSDYYDFVRSFRLVLPAQVFSIDISLYNTMLQQAKMIFRTKSENGKPAYNFTKEKAIQAEDMISVLIGTKSTAILTTVRIIARNLIRDIIVNEVLTESYLQSKFINLYNEGKLRVENDLTFFQRIFNKVIEPKEVDVNLKKVEKKEKSSFPEPLDENPRLVRLLTPSQKLDLEQRLLANEKILAKRASIEVNAHRFRPEERIVIAQDEIKTCCAKLRVALYAVRPMAVVAMRTRLPRAEDVEQTYAKIKRLQECHLLQELRLKSSFLMLLRARNEILRFKDTIAQGSISSNLTTIDNFVKLVREGDPLESKGVSTKEDTSWDSGISTITVEATASKCNCQNIKCQKQHPEWCTARCKNVNCNKRHCDFWFDGSMRGRNCICYYTCSNQKCRFNHARWCENPMDCGDENCWKRHCWEDPKQFLGKPPKIFNNRGNHQRSREQWNYHQERDDSYYIGKALEKPVPEEAVRPAKKDNSSKEKSDQGNEINIQNEPIPRKRRKKVDFEGMSEKVYRESEYSDDDSGESQFL
jgi:hypothetical protein